MKLLATFPEIWNMLPEMTENDFTQRLRDALNSEQPSEAVFELAKHLRDGGMKQDELQKLYLDECMLQGDTDDQKYDALADTLDYITGFCSAGSDFYPENRIFLPET